MEKYILKCGIAALLLAFSALPGKMSSLLLNSTDLTALTSQRVESTEFPEASPDNTPVPVLGPPDKHWSMRAVYCTESFSYMPPEDMEIEEIAYHLVEQVMDYVSGYHEECSYQITNYEIVSVGDIKWNDEESCWVTWPEVKIAWTGWYGIQGIMPEDQDLVLVGESDTGLDRVKIVEENGMYTLMCWPV